MRIVMSRSIVTICLSSALLWSKLLGAQSHPDRIEQFLSDLRTWHDAQRQELIPAALIVYPLPIVPDPVLTSNGTPAREALLSITDTAPLPLPVFTSSQRTTYSVYLIAANHHEHEKPVLTREQQKQLKSAQAVLFHRSCAVLTFIRAILHFQPAIPRPSKKYVKYQRFAEEKAEAMTVLNATHDPATRAALESRIGRIEADWKKKGHKDEVANAIAVYKQIMQSNPELFWVDVLSIFRLNSTNLSGKVLPNTIVMPPATNWGNSKEWQHWSAGSSSGDILIVAIERPWMNMELFTTHRWTWTNSNYSHEGILISDGQGLSTRRPQKELLPLLPIKIILARHISSGAQSVIGDDPRIVALICMIVPKSPP